MDNDENISKEQIKRVALVLRVGRLIAHDIDTVAQEIEDSSPSECEAQVPAVLRALQATLVPDKILSSDMIIAVGAVLPICNGYVAANTRNSRFCDPLALGDTDDDDDDDKGEDYLIASAAKVKDLVDQIGKLAVGVIELQDQFEAERIIEAIRWGTY